MQPLQIARPLLEWYCWRDEFGVCSFLPAPRFVRSWNSKFISESWYAEKMMASVKQRLPNCCLGNWECGIGSDASLRLFTIYIHLLVDHQTRWRCTLRQILWLTCRCNLSRFWCRGQTCSRSRPARSKFLAIETCTFCICTLLDGEINGELPMVTMDEEKLCACMINVFVKLFGCPT